MNLFILFHSTRYNPNLVLLPKSAGHLFYQPSRSFFLFCIYGRDPVVRVILAGNVLIPCMLSSQLRLTYCHVKMCSQNNSKVAAFAFV